MTAAPRKRAPNKKQATPTPEPRRTTAASEPREGFVDIKHCGITLRIPVGDDVPLELMELVDVQPQNEAERRAHDIALTRALLGPEQWEAFKATQPRWRDYLELGEKLDRATGK